MSKNFESYYNCLEEIDNFQEKIKKDIHYISQKGFVSVDMISFPKRMNGHDTNEIVIVFKEESVPLNVFIEIKEYFNIQHDCRIISDYYFDSGMTDNHMSCLGMVFNL